MNFTSPPYYLRFSLFKVFGGSLASCVLYVPPPLANGQQLLLPMTSLTNRTICLAMKGILDATPSSFFAAGSLCSPPDGLVLPSNETRCRIAWYRSVSGFDHVGEALLTLTEVATLQGWGRIMHTAISATPPVNAVEQVRRAIPLRENVH